MNLSPFSHSLSKFSAASCATLLFTLTSIHIIWLYGVTGVEWVKLLRMLQQIDARAPAALKKLILARAGNGGGPRAPSHPCQEISSPKQSGSVSGCFSKQTFLCLKILIVIHYSKSSFNAVNEIIFFSKFYIQRQRRLFW